MTWRIEYTGGAQRFNGACGISWKTDWHTWTIHANSVLHLQGTPYQDLWRYRVGNYRIITEIDNDSIHILVVRVAHRREAY